MINFAALIISSHAAPWCSLGVVPPFKALGPATSQGCTAAWMGLRDLARSKQEPFAPQPPSGPVFHTSKMVAVGSCVLFELSNSISLLLRVSFLISKNQTLVWLNWQHPPFSRPYPIQLTKGSKMFQTQCFGWFHIGNEFTCTSSQLHTHMNIHTHVWICLGYRR